MTEEPTTSAAKSAETREELVGLPAEGDYVLDVEQTTLGFRAKAFCLVWVNGTLKPTSGVISVEADSIEGHGTASAASVDTRLAARNWHLRTSHYLHAKKHPEVRFRVGRSPLDARDIEAELEVRDRKLRFPVHLQQIRAVGEQLDLKVSGTFDRRGLGMLPRGMGVSRLVHLDMQIVAVRRQA